MSTGTTPTLRDTADDVSKMLSTVSGILSPRVEPQVTEPTLEIEVNLAAAQRHGLRPGDVRREATTLISGLPVGNLYEEQKVFDVVVWGGPAIRQSLSDLEALRIDAPSGQQVRLGEWQGSASLPIRLPLITTACREALM